MITRFSHPPINTFERRKLCYFSFSCGQFQKSTLCDVTKSVVSNRWQTAQTTILRLVHNYPSLSAYLNCLIAPLLLFPSSHVEVAITWFIPFQDFFLNSTLLCPTCRTSTWWIEWTCDRLCSCSSAGLWKKMCSLSIPQWPRDRGKKRQATKYPLSPDNCSHKKNLTRFLAHCKDSFQLPALLQPDIRRITPSTNVLEQRCTRLSMSGLPSL